ncbi:MAG: gliding motility-associated C-terminal domain-containing protein [Bacteroidetes bacterium]|nr:gliding motility-associated C-terminal domain-containing protein [Bacteroidota bacterium]
MKTNYPIAKRKLLFVFFTMLLLVFFNEAKACHGLPLLNLTATPVAGGIQIDANSDPSTCGCDPYWMEVEVTCNPAGFTGAPPVPSSLSWGNMPWFHSNENIPNIMSDACALEPYNSILLPYPQMCTGTIYYWRAREYVQGDNSQGPWSASASFTTPGIPPSSILTAVANQYDACPGTTLQLTASVSGGCPGATYNYSWSPTTGLSNPNIANPTALVSTAITYTVTTSGGCFTITSADDTVGITLAPNVTPGTATGNPLSICSGGSSQIVLSGMGSNNIQWQVSPNGTSWFNLAGQTDDTLNTGTLSSSLYYQALVTGSGWPGSGCGTVASNSVLITVLPSPTANAGANTTICSGSCANLTGSGGVSYNWMPGNLSGATVSVCPGSFTTYTLTVTDASGCTGTDQVDVSVSIASVTASPDVSICTGNSTILLASGPAGNTYSWQPSATLSGANTANPSATPASTTTYTVTAVNSFGCTAIDSVIVTVTAAPPLTLSNDTALCAGAMATLNASGATSYNWQPGNMSGPTVTVSPMTTTTYVITGNNGNCMSTDSIIVSITPPPSVFAGPDFAICNGQQATLSVATGGTYNWQSTTGIIGSNTTQNIVVDPTSNTSYTITVTGPGGCISTDTINLTVNPVPNVTASATSTSICIGQSTTLNSNGATSYQWIPNVALSNPNSSSSNANPPNTTTYQVVGTDANGCRDTASITITVNPLPNVNILGNPTECGDTTGFFSDGGVVTGTGPFTYQIGSQTYSTLPISGFTAGNYTITTTDANGCTSSQIVGVNEVNTAVVNAAANPTFGVYPLNVQFAASGTSGINNYLWSFGGTGTSSNFTYTAPGTYTVVLTAYNDDPSCAVYDTLVITVVEQASILLPNVFTPNADGTNDNFSATVTGVSDMKIEVFDRWGARVRESEVHGLSSSPQDVALWDGKSKGGSVAADGTYYYIVTATGYDTKLYTYSGFVTLIKDKP